MTINLTQTQAFLSLKEHAKVMKKTSLTELFEQDASRFPGMSISAAGLFMDFSKQPISQTTLDLLIKMCRECDLEKQRDDMFSGKKVNVSENRAVLHTALRSPPHASVFVDGKNVIPDIHAMLEKMRIFADKIHSGAWRGYTNKKITDVVNIGIGGSDTGPRMVCRALKNFHQQNLSIHFVSNADGHDIFHVLKKLNPETTLFIIASKTFTTLETMLNANSAKNWFLEHAQNKDIAKHFVAISTNRQGVSEFGIDPENMFEFWDWVGGRYSVWSAIGLIVLLSIGFDHFCEFLSGAHAMDVHFAHAPLENNMPVILGLIGIWHRNFLGATSHSIAPYLQDLVDFPIYMQQLDMESNGKSIQRNGQKTDYPTGPVIWGNIGTNGQHAYFQLLHQGTEIIPVDFISALTSHHDLPNHHATLLANCFAQSEALMLGKSMDIIQKELPNDLTKEEEKIAVAQRTFKGGRPSTTILMNVLRPETLGALLALYEHKIFVQGILWNINSFDQWGVELGKQLAKTIQQDLTSHNITSHDSSTAGLVEMAKHALGQKNGST